jgi:hypothetical protein
MQPGIILSLLGTCCKLGIDDGGDTTPQWLEGKERRNKGLRKEGKWEKMKSKMLNFEQ